MKQFIKLWSAWIALRPFASFTFAFLFGLGCGVIGGMELPLKTYWVMAGIFSAALLFLAWVDWKKITASITIGAMLCLPMSIHSEEQQPIRPAGAIIAIGVGLGLLIGFGVITVLVVDQCAKNKKQNKKAVDDMKERKKQSEDSSMAPIHPASSSSSVYAGTQVTQIDYCSLNNIQAASFDDGEPEVGVIIPVTITSSGSVTMGVVQVSGDSDMVDWDTYTELLQESFGVTYSGNLGDKSYAVNGQPANETEVPFRVINNIMTIYPHLEQKVIALEVKRNDYSDWAELARVSAPVGHTVNFSATTKSKSAIYRVCVR